MSVDLDRLKASFDQAVESALPNVDYFALYTCQVVSQNSDGTLDLQPNRTDWPSQKNIPFRAGLPGIKMTVQAGAQVLLGWENGDPSVPFAGLWLTGASGDLQTVQVNAAQEIDLLAPVVKVGTNATQAAGRVGDQVQVTIPIGTVIVSVTPGPPAVGVPNPIAITLTGTITAGSSEVTIG